MKRSELKQIIRDVIEESINDSTTKRGYGDHFDKETGSHITVDRDGTEMWKLKTKVHRVGGPAITQKNGAKFWYQNEKLHREDGPAYIGSDGELGWFLNGKEYSEDEFNEKMCISKQVEEGAMIDGIKKAGTTAKNAIRSMFNGLVPGAHFHLNWNGSINIFDPIYQVDKIDAERNVISYHNILTDKPSSFYLDEVIDEFKKSKTLPGFQKTAILLTEDKLDEAIIINDRLDVILRRGGEFKVKKGSYAILNSNSVYDVDASVWEIVKKPGADRTIGLRARHNTEGYAHSVVTAGGFETPLEEVEKYRLIAYYLKAEIEGTTVLYPISNIIEDAKIFHKENL